MVGRIARYSIFNEALVSGTGEAVSSAINIKNASGNFSFAGILSSSVSSAIVTYEASADGTNFDTTTTDPTRTVISVLKGVYLIKGFNLPLAKAVRIKVKGLTGNPTSVTVTGKLLFTED